MGSIEIVIENRFGDSRDMFLRVHSRIEAGVTVELTESAILTARRSWRRVPTLFTDVW